MNKTNKDALLKAQNLTDKQFAALKEYYVDRIVDNMSMKDLVIYVTDDMQRWIAVSYTHLTLPTIYSV